MPETLRLTHKEAVILMDEVFAPFMRQWQNDPRLQSLVNDPEAYHRFLIEMAHALGVLLHGGGDALTHLKSLCQQALAAGLPLNAVEGYARQFLQTFEQWVRQAPDSQLAESRDTVLARIQQVYQDQIHCEAGDPPPGDDFILADSEHMDQNIDSMHNITAGRQAISAQELLAQDYLSEESIARIVEDINDLSNELYFYGDFDQEYAQFVIGHLEEISNALDSTVEFEDLGWAVRQFIHVLRHLPEGLTPELASAVKQLTDQFVEDLASWVNHVLIEQDAQDIHYLDAAMLASVKQIALILGIEIGGRDGSATVSASGSDQSSDDFVMF